MANERRDDLLRTVGKAGLSAMFPNDFEYYALTLELVDSKGRTVRYLTFPVSPESMSYDNVQVANVRKTMGGVSALDNATFTPKSIQISGTFGRKFRLLIQPPQLPDKPVGQGGLQLSELAFDPKLKSGYGTTKYLEKMINESSQLDDYNQPYRLYLYNPTLNHNFWVKATRHSLSQDRASNNMMWKYDITFTAISPLDRVQDGSTTSLTERLAFSALQSTANKVTKSIRNVLKRGIEDQL